MPLVVVMSVFLPTVLPVKLRISLRGGRTHAVAFCVLYGKLMASIGILTYMDKIFKITMSVGCAVSRKIPNIQISTIENIVKLNALLNSDTYGRYLTVLFKLYKFSQKERLVFSGMIVTVIMRK